MAEDETSVDVTQGATGQWVSADPGSFSADDLVRVTQRRSGTVVTGTVSGSYTGGDGTEWLVVRHDQYPRGESFSAEYRTFEKWIPAEAQVTETVLARPQVGDRFTRRFNHPSYFDRAGCVVVSVRDAGEAPGQTLWLLTYADAHGWYRDGELLVRPDGTCNPYVPVNEARDTTGMYVPEVTVRSTPTGWVSVTNFEVLCEDDIVRAVPNGIGGRMQARVTDSGRHGFTAMTTHVIAASLNGRSTDLTCWGCGYTYGDEGDVQVWRGEGPAPAPDAEPLISEERWQAATTSAEGSLPAWATSLDAAKRHVHAVARRLYRRGDNCYDGSSDFVAALGLPNISDAWPAPVPVDETEQIREFLAKVREVAFEVANDHGKDTDLVEGWLTREGIVKPALPPVSFTVTVTAPAGTTLDEVRRLGYSIDGWEVR